MIESRETDKFQDKKFQKQTLFIRLDCVLKQEKRIIYILPNFDFSISYCIL